MKAMLRLGDTSTTNVPTGNPNRYPAPQNVSYYFTLTKEWFDSDSSFTLRLTRRCTAVPIDTLNRYPAPQNALLFVYYFFPSDIRLWVGELSPRETSPAFAVTACFGARFGTATATLSCQLQPYPANCRHILPTAALSCQLPPYPANRRPILQNTALSCRCPE